MALWQLTRCLAVTTCLLLPVVYAQGDDDLLTETERAWLDGHGPIRYGYEPGYAPFEFTDAQGHPVGINFDILDAMARNLGLVVEKLEHPDFESVLDAARDGSIDLVGTINRTEDREAFLEFSDPYIRLSSVFYVTDDVPKASGFEGLQGLRIGVVGSYVSAQWLAEEHPELDLHPFDTLDALANALASGRVDAAFEESATMGYLARERGLTNLRVLEAETGLESDQHWAVPRGESVLLSIINKGLASLSPGDQRKIFEYWTGYDLGLATAAPTSVSPMARNIILGVSGLFVAAGVWSVSLRRQVKHRTRDLQTALRQQRAAEQETLRLNRGLEAQVQQRTEELQRSNDDLRAFASTLSHDLQSPLSVVAIHSSLLETHRPDDEAITNSARKIAAAGQRMNALIKGTLAYAKAKTLPDMRPVDVDQVLEDVLDNLEAHREEEQATIHVGPMPRVAGNHVQLVQLFQNLIGNALKFHRDGVPPRVRVRARRSGERVAIDVEDNGTGFDPDQLDELLQPFARLEEHGQVEGHGLGLATCALILKHHGGRIEATSRPGHGTTFTVWLPVAVEDAHFDAGQRSPREHDGAPQHGPPGLRM